MLNCLPKNTVRRYDEQSNELSPYSFSNLLPRICQPSVFVLSVPVHAAHTYCTDSGMMGHSLMRTMYECFTYVL